MSLDNVKFRRPVLPGDQLRCELEMLQNRGPDLPDEGRGVRGRQRGGRGGDDGARGGSVTTVIHPTAIVDPVGRAGPRASRSARGRWSGPSVHRWATAAASARARGSQRNVRLGRGRAASATARSSAATRRTSSSRARRPGSRSGDGTIIREYSTINRGTSATYRTVGRRALLHHDVRAPRARLPRRRRRHHRQRHPAARATSPSTTGRSLSGLNAIHQFVTIGTYAFVGGGSRVNQDIPPYVKAVGNPMELYGLNSIGLQRAGFSGETIAALKRAYRLFFNSDLNLSQALERARERPAAAARGRAVPRLRRVVRARRAGVSAPPAGRRGRRRRARPAPRPASCADARRRRAGRRVTTSTTSARPRGRGRAGHRAFAISTTLLDRVEAVTVAVPTPAHAEVGLARARSAGSRS